MKPFNYAVISYLLFSAFVMGFGGCKIKSMQKTITQGRVDLALCSSERMTAEDALNKQDDEIVSLRDQLEASKQAADIDIQSIRKEYAQIEQDAINSLILNNTLENRMRIIQEAQRRLYDNRPERTH